MKKILISMMILVSFCFESANMLVFHSTLNDLTDITTINGKIRIPRIRLEKEFYYNGNVDKNIIVIKPSEHPSIENSLLILAAHSGSGKYAYFNYLYKLEINDFIYIISNNVTYKYKVIDIYNVKKDGNIPVYRVNNKNTLILVTCTNNSKKLQTVYVSIGV